MNRSWVKIVGTPEGREGVWLITNNTAQRIVDAVPGDTVHNFIGNGSPYLGADWSKEDVLAFFDRRDLKVALVFPPAFTMKHQLVAIDDERRWMFDVGEIPESDMITPEGWKEFLDTLEASPDGAMVKVKSGGREYIPMWRSEYD